MSRPEALPDAVLVSVVVVNWNTAELLGPCLGSLAADVEAGTVGEVIVVDNGSTDGSRDVLAREWPGVRVVANTENRGYQAANNQGMRIARGEHLLLLNTDAMLQPGCLALLLAAMRSDPRTAVVGPRLVYADGRFQRWTAGSAPSLSSAAASFLMLDRVAPRAGIWIGRDVDVPFEPHWVSSACMLVRRSMLDEVGLMDETFFAYMDDVDLCARARAAGWTVRYEPRTSATHLMGRSTQQAGGGASPLALRGLLRYYALSHGRSATWAMQGIAGTGFALRALAHGVAGRHRPDHRRAAHQHWRNARLSLTPVPPERSLR